MCLDMYVCGYVHMGEGAPQRPEDGLDSPEDGVTGSYEPNFLSPR